MPSSKAESRATKVAKKPIIFFDPNMSQPPELGKRCHITVTTPHPKIGWTNYIITSSVKFIYEDGSFRTHNSIYKPEPSHDE